MTSGADRDGHGIPLFILGDSHTMCLAEALRLACGPANRPPTGTPVAVGLMFPFSRTMAPFHLVRDGRVAFADPEATGRLAALTGSAAFLPAGQARYAITMVYTTSLILWRSAWFWCRPWRVAKPGLGVVSDAVMAAIADRHFVHVVAFLDALKAAGADALVIESPPPRSDDRSLATGRVERDAIIEIERLTRARIDERLAGLGVDVVRCPPESYAGAPRNSLLRDDLRNIRPPGLPVDTHHANRRYGEMMLRAVHAHLDRGAAAAPREGRAA